MVVPCREFTFIVPLNLPQLFKAGMIITSSIINEQIEAEKH